MLTAQEIYNILKQEKGIDVTLEQVENILVSIDQEAMLQEEKSKYKIEIWDKKTPINGVAPLKFLSRPDVGSGEIYLIKEVATDNVVFFQPHNPNMSGFVQMTKDNVLDIAEGHLTNFVQHFVNEQVISMVLNNI